MKWFKKFFTWVGSLRLVDGRTHKADLDLIDTLTRQVDEIHAVLDELAVPMGSGDAVHRIRTLAWRPPAKPKRKR